MEKELTLRDYMQADDDIEICTWEKGGRRCLRRW